MRRSHEGLTGIIKDNYKGLPKELQEFNYYYSDGLGHVVMSVPEGLLKEAEEYGDLDMYECPVPVKYVLENGYQIYREHVVCDVKYDPVFGIDNYQNCTLVSLAMS